MVDHRAPLQTEPTIGGQQGIAGHLRAHLTIAQDEVGKDREHRATRGALETPDGEIPQPDSDIMGVARQAPAPATGRLVPQLKAQGEDERDHPFDKGVAVVKQPKIGRFIVEINSDGTVLPRSYGGYAHVSPPGQQVSSVHETQWG
jgi:hypothetical protein